IRGPLTAKASWSMSLASRTIRSRSPPSSPPANAGPAPPSHCGKVREWRTAMALRYAIAAKKVPSSIDKHVGSWGRIRRKMLAMSQEQLAISYQQVQKCEKGANRIGASRLQQISHILQVPVAFFFEGAPNALAPHDFSGSALSMAQIDDFVSGFKRLKVDESVHAN